MTLKDIISEQDKVFEESSKDWLWGFIPDGDGDENNAYIAEAEDFDKIKDYLHARDSALLEGVREFIEQDIVYKIKSSLEYALDGKDYRNLRRAYEKIGFDFDKSRFLLSALELKKE